MGARSRSPHDSLPFSWHQRFPCPGQLDVFSMNRMFDAEEDDAEDVGLLLLSDTQHQTWWWEAAPDQQGREDSVAGPTLCCREVTHLSSDGGATWSALADGLPNSPVVVHLVVISQAVSVSRSQQVPRRRELQRECLAIELRYGNASGESP